MTFCRTLLPVLTICSVSLAADLNDLSTVQPDTMSRRASSFDLTGGNDDNIMSFAPKANHVLLDTEGPGRINHIWLTVAPFPKHPTYLRDLVIRMYWENASVPSVEVPLGDFFALGHGKQYTIESAPIAVGINVRALNCYWPMPFYKHARIEVYNNGSRSIRRIYYHVDYELGPQPPNQGLFHALFRYEPDLKGQPEDGNTTGRENYVILETEGTGQYVGCALFVDAGPEGWWGEGDDMIFIDHADKPTIIGTGTEDYFNNAWGYDKPFSYPYYGCPLLETRPGGGTITTVYRWHVTDPLRFQKHIKVTMEHIYSEQVGNDYSSVAYWYQIEPIKVRPSLPVAEANHPKQHVDPAASTAPADVKFQLSATILEADLNKRGISARAITAALSAGYRDGGWLKIENISSQFKIQIPVPEEGTYHVQIKPVSHILGAPMRIALDDNAFQTFERHSQHESKTPYLDLGTTDSQNKTLTLFLGGAPTQGIDNIRIEKITTP